MKTTETKKTISIVILILIALLLAVIFVLAYFIKLSPEAVELNPDRLVNIKGGFDVLDVNGAALEEAIPIRSVRKARIDYMPDYVKQAFIAVEDKRFYQHDGIDSYRIFGAIKNNIFSGRFKEGASTITQQLIKNTHLSGQKNIARKLNEIRLARELEKSFTKEQILEMYVNTIYFGNNAYGIENASNTYFNKSATNLTVSQAALLAGLIKAPTTYAPNNNLNKCLRRRNLVLKLMKEQGYIDEESFNIAINEKIDVTLINRNKNYYKRYMHGAIQEACSILKISEKQLSESKLKIYTYYDAQTQKLLEKSIFDAKIKTFNGNPSQVCGIIADNKTSGISAFCGISRYNLYTLKRNIGSTAKPLVVYAPALEERIITPATPINDESINFDGYAPKNYGGKYYGWIPMRKAIAKSLNSTAIKTLNALTPKKARKYLIANGFKIHKSDKNLSMALGSFNNGIDLLSLTGGYMTLANNGEYRPVRFIKKITNDVGKILYEHKPKAKKVFGNDTAFLMTDMLKSVVNEGTAEKLRLNFDIAAKTGTTGMGKSKNNTDALIVSYTTLHTITMWCGGYPDDPLPQSVTGGGIPALVSKKLYTNLYSDSMPQPFTPPDSVTRLILSKKELEEHHRIKVVEETGSDTFSEYFSLKNCPDFDKQTPIQKYLPPKLILELNEKGLPLISAQTETEIHLYRINNNGDERLIASFGAGNIKYIDSDIKRDASYSYYAYAVKDGIRGVKSKIQSIYVPPVPDNIPPNEDWWQWIYKLIN